MENSGKVFSHHTLDRLPRRCYLANADVYKLPEVSNQRTVEARRNALHATSLQVAVCTVQQTK